MERHLLIRLAHLCQSRLISIDVDELNMVFNEVYLVGDVKMNCPGLWYDPCLNLHFVALTFVFKGESYSTMNAKSG